MARPSSVLCPSCGTLVGVNDPQCLNCGRRNPGMWGFAHLLRAVGDDMGFTKLVIFVCGALYLACLASDAENIRSGGMLNFLSPSGTARSCFSVRAAVCRCTSWALVDRAQRRLAARRRPAHPVQHDVGAGPRAGSGPALRPRPRRHHLHGLIRHGFPAEQHVSATSCPALPFFQRRGDRSRSAPRPRSSGCSGRCSTTAAAAAARWSASRRRASRWRCCSSAS